MEWLQTLGIGLLVMLARMADVTIGTLRVQPLLKAYRDQVFYTLDYGGISNKVLMPRTKTPVSRRRSPMRK